MWLYGSGFPKSMNIGLAVDKKNGVESKVIGKSIGNINAMPDGRPSRSQIAWESQPKEYEIKEAQNEWQGWGTCLKPAFEPIIVARKPFKGSLVDNVIKWGVGGLNIDECRVETNDRWVVPAHRGKEVGEGYQRKNKSMFVDKPENVTNENGRFPANLILTYEQMTFDEVCGGFPDTNPSKQIIGGANRKSQTQEGRISDGGWKETNRTKKTEGYNDNGGSASRYFYCAKASKKDRDEGCEYLEDTVNACSNQAIAELKRGNENFANETNSTFNKIYKGKNTHPTVKPTELMQYLVRLVTPDNGTVLDCFMGSGSTGKAAMYENLERNKNYSFIGIEREPEYYNIAKARIEYVEGKINIGGK